MQHHAVLSCIRQQDVRSFGVRCSRHLRRYALRCPLMNCRGQLRYFTACRVSTSFIHRMARYRPILQTVSQRSSMLPCCYHSLFRRYVDGEIFAKSHEHCNFSTVRSTHQNGRWSSWFPRQRSRHVQKSSCCTSVASTFRKLNCVQKGA